MILPGISGSFILLLIGMYSPVLGAVKEFQISHLSTLFLSGCSAWATDFLSRTFLVIARSFRDFTLVFLTGLMIGTLPKITALKTIICLPLTQKIENQVHSDSRKTYLAISTLRAWWPLSLLGWCWRCDDAVAIALVLGLEKFARA